MLLLLPVLAYWIYLAFSTAPVMIFDAVGYEEAGRIILERGWAAYFHQLNREPLFPALVAAAMAAGKVFSLPYFLFLRGILFGLFALALWGIYRLARLMDAGRGVALAFVIYAGLSPAMLNSMLWLWSEGAALPWAVWGVFFSVKAWRSAFRGSVPRVASYSGLALASFTALLLVKAAVVLVVPLFILPFVAAGFACLVRKHFVKAWSLWLAAAIIGGIFTGIAEGWKYANWKMNGNYVLTSRIELALFGNTVRRLEPLTRERLAQAVLSVPRLGLCEKYYGKACVFWGYLASDQIMERAVKYCDERGLTPEQQRQFLMGHAFRLMREHPVQQAALSLLEASKMLFWENRVYFVRYPQWLVKVYSANVPVFVLCFGWALLSLGSLIFAFCHRTAAVLIPAWFALMFMAAYAIFFIDIRYALPIAPLFIALTAGMAGNFIRGCFSRQVPL